MSKSRFFTMAASGCGLLLFASSYCLSAQAIPSAPVEIYGGFSYLSLRPTERQDRVNLNGWQSTLTYFPARRFGMAADFGGNYGHMDQHSYLFGPQLRLLRRGRVESSFRVLVGTARVEGESGFASSLGSAIDIRLHDRVAWRIQPGIFLTRYDSDLQRNFRLSTGLVFRLGGKR